MNKRPDGAWPRDAAWFGFAFGRLGRSRRHAVTPVVSLGLGGDAFSPEAVDGSILTLILDIGVPAVLLAAGR